MLPPERQLLLYRCLFAVCHPRRHTPPRKSSACLYAGKRSSMVLVNHCIAQPCTGVRLGLCWPVPTEQLGLFRFGAYRKIARGRPVLWSYLVKLP